MRLFQKRFAAEIVEEAGVGRRPYVDHSGHMFVGLGGKKRAGLRACGPGDIEILKQRLFVLVVMGARPAVFGPDMNTAFPGNRPEQRRFSAAVFACKERDVCPELDAAGVPENGKVEGIDGWIRKPFRMQGDSCDMHNDKNTSPEYVDYLFYVTLSIIYIVVR